MPNGIIVIDKPREWTSMDVCAKLRGILRERRVGHAGTLDPMATGVLPVFVGRATRAVEFAGESDKEYIAQIKLGVVTNTQDITGQVLETRPVSVTREQLEAALSPFRGNILQIPPMYSAIKRNGKKLYELARAGQEVERPPRPVTIHALELLDEGAAQALGDSGFARAADACLLRVRCSKGTYVRTLCHDIGAALGCGGCMSALRRTEAAGFTLSDAVTLEAVQAAEDPAALLRPADACFHGYGAVEIGGRALLLAKNGNPFPCPPGVPDGVYRFYGPGGEFLLLGRCAGGTATTIKSFFEV